MDDTMMYPGRVIKTRSVTAMASNERFHGSFTFTAPGKTKGKHTKNMLMLYLGLEDCDKPLTDDEIKELLNDIGWKQMTEKEFNAYEKKKEKAKKK